MKDTNQLPEPELGYIKTDKSNQPAFSARQMREAMGRATGEPVGGVVHQFRRQFCADWYDGNPDESSGGPYETRTLYTAPQPVQTTQAEVTDDQILAAGREWSKEQGWWDFEANDFLGCARAILALRPVQVPMTDEQILLAIDEANRSLRKSLMRVGGQMFSYQDCTEFHLVRVIEAHHGITAQAKKEGA